MSFTAVMPRSGRAGGFRIPSVHGEIGISTSNHEPVGRIGGHESTDFTPEFLQRCHAPVPYISGSSHLLRDRGLSQIWCQNRQFADLFPLRGTPEVGMIHHPNLGNDFADEVSMTEEPYH
jgi:hypothetical protein